MSTRGFMVVAVNTLDTDYVRCSYALAASLKRVMPNMPVSLLTTRLCERKYFDSVIALPYGVQPGFANDWQVYDASPYDETIKIEADMYIPRNIEHWFDILSVQDIAVCTKIRDHKGNISDSRFYRKFIDDNNLPDVYNALTYFKKSEYAKTFFSMVRTVFENWDDFKTILKCGPYEPASTDWVYAIVCSIMGVEKTTLPCFDEFSMIHMKSMITKVNTENWTDTMVYECLPDQVRIQTFAQQYPLHYHVKSFGDKIIKGIADGTKT